ncbi:MAG: beta-glucosidase [Alphaproteobacteria bacterium]|nr:MAG: beta-glucosidase [Caulobacteraceae bacterium]TPW08319.1 MAG: beta-glucosidase [Alphaproteobacteria bacterium]
MTTNSPGAIPATTFNWKQARRAALAACAALALATAPAVAPPTAEAQNATSGVTSRTVDMWPAAPHRRPADPYIEARIATIVSRMTLEQKIGQMTQAEIRSITPEQAREFHIGSILNGGGAWPAMHKHAAPAEWAALSGAFYAASMSTDMATPVPIIWGTDAVHGHNNVFGATLFPHNIGLGAARDPDLIYRIGRATARAVRATGITWAFAPTLAVVQDQRWGRTYESFSSDPALVRAYAGSYVRGLQGALNGDTDVIATAKHFLGDGGTWRGVDQGDTRTGLADLIRTHAQGYYGALDANVQTVMISYSSWNESGVGERGARMHANRYLITDVLKGRLGFDGLVVSDWNAIEQVPGCTRTHCPEVINAGVDMVMVPDDWRAFIDETVADVRRGDIAVSRIDDAVSRILRVKLRSGLFDSSPAASAAAMEAASITDAPLAREAVRKSLVLLKNANRALPLARESRVLVIGKGADSFPLQSGGWSRTWQGTENVNEDYATGETLLAGIRRVVGADHVRYSETGAGVDPRQFDVVIAALAEQPYAEMKGDVTFPATMSHSARYPEDLAALDAVSGQGVPVVTVLYSGRTVYANDLINRSGAFVAAWLPGTEAGAIADVLFRGPDGRVQHDFSGRLPFAWPRTACDSTGRAARFPAGFGLRYSRPQRLGALPEGSAAAPCSQ